MSDQPSGFNKFWQELDNSCCNPLFFLSPLGYHLNCQLIINDTTRNDTPAPLVYFTSSASSLHGATVNVPLLSYKGNSHFMEHELGSLDLITILEAIALGDHPHGPNIPRSWIHHGVDSTFWDSLPPINKGVPPMRHFDSSFETI